MPASHYLPLRLHTPEPDPVVPPPKDPPAPEPGPIPEREPPEPQQPPIGDPPAGPRDARPMR